MTSSVNDSGCLESSVALVPLRKHKMISDPQMDDRGYVIAYGAIVGFHDSQVERRVGRNIQGRHRE